LFVESGVYILLLVLVKTLNLLKNDQGGLYKL